MRQHQDALALALAHLRRRLAFQDVAEAVDARRAIEREAEVAELALDFVDHDIDRLGVVTRALDRHPLDDAVEHFLGIDLRFVLQFGHRRHAPDSASDHLTLRSIAKRCVSKGGQQTRCSCSPFETRPAAAPQGEVGYLIRRDPT